jgi:chorismate mutase/prephenate dehydratase
MAKKKAVKGSESSSRGRLSAGLSEQIDDLDRRLLALLNDRAKLVREAAEGCGAAGGPVPDSIEGQERWRRLEAVNEGPLSDRCVQAVFRELISGCRELVRPLKVAYLGPQFSFSHIAAVKRFGESVELAPVATIAAVFEELGRRQADYGLVPVENSTDGRVADTLDMFARVPMQICGEVQLRIHHNLLAKCPRAAVQEVCSKPQALSQCRDWLAKHLPTVRTVEMASTAAAAQWAAEKAGAAAIASLQAAASYGLDVIASNIEDNRHNVTRFAVIGDRPAPWSGADKTSLMFEIAHRPGALADALAIFKRNRLNLTWIESFPMPGSKHEYLFFVEFEGHRDDGQVRLALASLKGKTLRVEVLGSYAKSAVVD